MSEGEQTEEEVKAQVAHENDVQRRARDIAESERGPECGCIETYPQLIPGRISHGPGCDLRERWNTLCEAVRIYARDDAMSMGLAQQAVEVLERFKSADNRILHCGWCELVLGSAAAEIFPSSEACQAHVHGCEHNPLVMLTKNLRAALEEACDIAMAYAVEANHGNEECAVAGERIRRARGYLQRIAELRKVGAP